MRTKVSGRIRMGRLKEHREVYMLPSRQKLTGGRHGVVLALREDHHPRPGRVVLGQVFGQRGDFANVVRL